MVSVVLLLLLLLLLLLSLPPSSQVVAAIVKGSPASRKRYSAYIIHRALLHWYETCNLTPRGVSVWAASVVDWSLRTSNAARKLARHSTATASINHRVVLTYFILGSMTLCSFRSRSSRSYAGKQTLRGLKPWMS